MSIIHDRLMWIDIETDGVGDDGHILEIGFTLTSYSGQKFESTPPEKFIFPLDRGNNPIDWPENVLKMHVDNGLLFEVKKVPPRADTVHHIAQWWKTIEAGRYKDGQLFVPAGSGFSHFDRRVIKRQLPWLDVRLTHYSIDVGVIRRAMEFAGASHPALRPPAPKTNHRALNCNEDHIRQWGHFRSMVQDLQDHYAGVGQ